MCVLRGAAREKGCVRARAAALTRRGGPVLPHWTLMRAQTRPTTSASDAAHRTPQARAILALKLVLVRPAAAWGARRGGGARGRSGSATQDDRAAPRPPLFLPPTPHHRTHAPHARAAPHA
jgi:hypothetical protein